MKLSKKVTVEASVILRKDVKVLVLLSFFRPIAVMPL